jgi:hypothetical protein
MKRKDGRSLLGSGIASCYLMHVYVTAKIEDRREQHVQLIIRADWLFLVSTREVMEQSDETGT